MTIIIFLVISVIISIIYSIYSGDDIVEFIGRLIFSIFIGFFIGLVISLIIPSKIIDKKELNLKLINISDGNDINGNFYLGFGNIDNKMKYVFYYKIDTNTYSLFQVDYKDAILKYTDSTQIPHVDVYVKKYDTNYFWNKFALDLDVGKVRYVIFIPKGTIKNNYILDAQ